MIKDIVAVLFLGAMILLVAYCSNCTKSDMIKIDNAVNCSQIAADCFQVIKGISEAGDPLDAADIALSCAKRWHDNGCDDR